MQFLDSPTARPQALAARHYILNVLMFIRPCSPIATKTVPVGNAWLHEPKLDGYRLQVIKEGRKVRLYGRCGNEWTGLLAIILEALAAVPCRSAPSWR
jgi:bifunctional non-homologous end joining protein LigD